jgi:hypothetical protein
MNLTKIKKLGNKIYSLSVKIEEADKSGMVTRIQGYTEKLDDAQKELKTEIDQLLKKI